MKKQKHQRQNEVDLKKAKEDTGAPYNTKKYWMTFTKNDLVDIEEANHIIYNDLPTTKVYDGQRDITYKRGRKRPL